MALKSEAGAATRIDPVTVTLTLDIFHWILRNGGYWTDNYPPLFFPANRHSFTAVFRIIWIEYIVNESSRWCSGTLQTISEAIGMRLVL